VKGDQLDPEHLFQWDMVVENYPGSEDYDPTMPWMYKATLSEDGTVEVAADYKCFVDDVRPTDPLYVKCWAAA